MMKTDAKDKFYKPSVTVDIAVFTVEDNNLKVLTIKRAGDPYKGIRALPGGFLHKGETTLDTAKRILKDKVGLHNAYLEQLYTFDNPKRDPRGAVISVAYFALIPRQKLSLKSSVSAQDPAFIPVKSLGKLVFDHKEIINYAHERVRGKLEYTNIAFEFLPARFTFSELQNIYETIFLKDFDKRNFRKKINRLGLIKPTTEKVKRGRQRPALLYKPASESTQTFKNNF
jgi:8-oxo-dGTP diphosphatase